MRGSGLGACEISPARCVQELSLPSARVTLSTNVTVTFPAPARRRFLSRSHLHACSRACMCHDGGCAVPCRAVLCCDPRACPPLGTKLRSRPATPRESGVADGNRWNSACGIIRHDAEMSDWRRSEVASIRNGVDQKWRRSEMASIRNGVDQKWRRDDYALCQENLETRMQHLGADVATSTTPPHAADSRPAGSCRHAPIRRERDRGARGPPGSTAMFLASPGWARACTDRCRRRAGESPTDSR